MSKNHRTTGPFLLEAKDLTTSLFLSRGTIQAVNQVRLKIRANEKVGLVGESGCGKSMTARSIMRLVPNPPAKIVGGEVLFSGNEGVQDLLRMPENQMYQIRGGEIAMVFQDPMTYLNPTMRICDQVVEAIMLHDQQEGAYERAQHMLELVGLSASDGINRRYPHQLSGGMRQRVLLAIAAASRPKLLIADEPTTALDVTIQAQVLKLLNELVAAMEMSLLLITHDLGIVAECCDHVYVMYAGQIVEEADVFTLFSLPAHPYTQGLLACVLSIDEYKASLHTIGGNVPDLGNLPQGCSFRTRCSQALTICTEAPPVLKNSNGQVVRCWLYDPISTSGVNGRLGWERISDDE